MQAGLDALQVLLPGAFIVLVTWLGARAAVAGSITAGELVAFYAYAAFLVLPVRTATEVLQKLTRGHVAAVRVLGVLAVQPAVSDPSRAPPPHPDPLPSARGPRDRHPRGAGQADGARQRRGRPTPRRPPSGWHV